MVEGVKGPGLGAGGAGGRGGGRRGERVPDLTVQPSAAATVTGHSQACSVPACLLDSPSNTLPFLILSGTSRRSG